MIGIIRSNRRRMMLAFQNKDLVTSISPSNIGTDSTFTRASTATFVDNTTSADLSISPDSLGAGYTFTRASTATYQGE